jgi:hypothetical protein
MFVLTSELGTYVVCIPTLSAVKFEPNDDIVLVLSNFDDGLCSTMHLLDTSLQPFRIA